MAIDYAEKEREFLDSLQEDTGRDLAAWMAAIAATNLTDRNAIIHWLRQQGFLFARASWLERIFHNGGRPIYIGAGEADSGRTSKPEKVEVLATIQPRPAPVVPLVPELPARAERPAPAASLDALLAEAKAYRPLAQFVLGEIGKACPSVTLEPRQGYVSLVSRQRLAGVLTISPKELRLALALGGQPAPEPFTKARFPRNAPELPEGLTHMVVLTDARQVTPELVASVAVAAELP